MQSLSLREIQLAELEILIQFDAYCKKHHLRYSLCGGTLLGAVRHKGFIPWDDDIDVMMPRPDYEKLKHLATVQSIHQDMVFRCGENGEIGAPFGKILDTRIPTQISYISDVNSAYLWVDIYPVDGLPNDLEEAKKLYRKADCLMLLLGLAQAQLGEGRNIFKKYAKYLLKPLVQSVGVHRIMGALSSLTTGYDYESAKYVGVVIGESFGINERLPKELFDVFILLEFEGLYFSAMPCWEIYLTQCYGDYMILPKAKHRKGHIGLD